MSRIRVQPAALFVHGTIAAGAVVCTYAVWDTLTQPLSPGWLVLMALTAGAGWATLRVPKMPISFSISDTFTIVAALLVGPSAGALTAALDGLVLSFRMANNRRTLPRVLFNIACLALATWMASTAYFRLGGSQPLQEGPLGALRLLALAVLFGALHFALNSGLVARAVSFERRVPLMSIWREHFSGLWVSSFGGTFAAMLMIVLARNTILEVLILMAPLPVILYVALRHALGRAEDQIVHLGKLNRVYVATIEALAQAVDAKDQVTHDHVRRVQEKSLQLADALGVVDEGELQAIKAASLLHDVGKIGIPEHILNKPGRLTPSEFEIMKRHPAIGAEILSVVGFPYPLIPIVRHHHENWDGTGYPDGLAGEQIPIGARILQVVDCFDALTSDRPYRTAMADDEAMQIVTDRSGTMYDPRVVSALVELHAKDTAAAPKKAVTPKASSPAMPARATAIASAPGDDDPRRLLETAADLGAALAARGTPACVGDALWTSLSPSLPAVACVLFTYDAAAHVLRPAFCAGPPTVGTGTQVPIGERLSGWVAATRRTIVNSDARLDVDAAYRDETTLQAALATPIERHGDLVGVLAFYAERPDAFTESHQRLAEVASYVAANALRTPAPIAIAV